MATAGSTDFDYTVLAPGPRHLAIRNARAVQTHLVRSTKSVIDMGRRLIAVREQLDNRQWQAWLRCEFRWSRSVASNYMRVAEKFGGLDVVARFQPSALYALARKYVSPRAIADVVALARAGQTVSKAVARQMIRKYGTPNSGSRSVAELRRRIAKMSRQVGDLAQSTPRRELTQLADELEELAGQLRRGRRKPSQPQPRGKADGPSAGAAAVASVVSKPTLRATPSGRRTGTSVWPRRKISKRAAA